MHNDSERQLPRRRHTRQEAIQRVRFRTNVFPSRRERLTLQRVSDTTDAPSLRLAS